jgi:hypothetical protein
LKHDAKALLTGGAAKSGNLQALLPILNDRSIDV